MKITKIETWIVNPNPNAATYGMNWVFVKMHTDEGLHGIGQAYSAGPDAGTVAVIHDFEEWLVGRDPRQIEFLWALMYQGSRFPPGVVVAGALSGIEQCLWDIKGKALGVPVYELLGGKCRDNVRVYTGVYDATAEGMAANALSVIEKYGYSGLKISPQGPDYATQPENAQVRIAVERMEAVRRAVGPDIDIGVDIHARIFEPARALTMIEALKPYQPYFVEEPIRPENIEAMAQLHAKTTVPIATGESLYVKYQFQHLLAVNGCDIVQPDVCAAGGLLEMKKIAAMAEACYVSVAPHNPMSPVATAVNVHFAASTPNFLILEYTADDKPPRRDMVQEPMVLKDGHLELPTAPGLGIELNEEAFKHYPPHPWHRPFPFHADGSMGFI